MIHTVIVSSMQHIHLSQREARTCSIDTSGLCPAPSPKGSECVSQSEAAELWEHQKDTPAHQVQQRVEVPVCRSAQKVFVTLLNGGESSRLARVCVTMKLGKKSLYFIVNRNF